MQTLVQMARDIYPHDRLADRFYAVAVKDYDEKAATDAGTQGTCRGRRRRARHGWPGEAHGMRYVDVGWEAERVALLREDAKRTPFFQKVRGNLVTGLYNQQGGLADLRLRGRVAPPRAATSIAASTTSTGSERREGGYSMAAHST